MPSKLLVVKNFPNHFTSTDKIDLVKHFGAEKAYISPKCNRVVFAEYSHEQEAENALKTLHQMEVIGRRLRVEYAADGLATEVTEIMDTSKSKTMSDNSREVSSYFKNLIALNEKMNFHQPPLPYLRYKYPRADRDIIESISVALESIPKFYTQVLHLMNRMNLPPPFDVNHKLKKRHCDVAVQTEHDEHYQPLNPSLSDEESELESDAEGSHQKLIIPEQPKKRKSQMNLKNPLKKFRTSIVTSGPAGPARGHKDAFDETPHLQTRTIKIHAPDKLQPQQPSLYQVIKQSLLETPADEGVQPSTSLVTPHQLAENRLNEQQMSSLPVFKNYKPGVCTAKLYIKNLAKTVTVEDLQQIYDRYKRQHDEVDIKLMQAGRMKGQAFVMFRTRDVMEAPGILHGIVERARQETNAYILKDKPMVVVFGKVDKTTDDK